MRKIWKKALLALLCLVLAGMPQLTLTGEPAAVYAAAVKKGLRKEKGKYYFYVKNKRVVNTWKTVKETKNGKTTSYRYYFGRDGAAYMGKKETDPYTGKKYEAPVIKKIGGKKYAFDSKAHRLKGVYYINKKLYVFQSNGVLDVKKSKKIRKTAVYEKSTADLRAFLGEPKREVKLPENCYSADGDEYLLYYSNFALDVFRYRNGYEIYFDISAA